MKLNTKNMVDNLYDLYEFEKAYEDSVCNVYTYDQGYFNNAEIVVFENSEEKVRTIKNEFIKEGYSVSQRSADDYEAIKDKLFSGFFKVESSNKRVMHDYENYCDTQTKRLGGGKYSYVKSHYLLNSLLCEDDILDKIISLLNKGDAQLVILEAPAGFGKTCTAYEIANLLAQKSNYETPILTELSNNRTARIFRYVLLSEIDRKFSRLSSSLVIRQIKEGKIPLIIDGFDELLSKSKEDSEASENEVASMLDTIAEMLDGDSKARILLTSRKSSIFAGEVFDHWVENKLKNCEVNRIQILIPTVKDWIGIDKLSYLNDIGVDLDFIANPVLLSMLRGMTNEQLEGKFHSAKDILDNYFNIILEREKERQQLLISVDKQIDIMRKLAAIMVQLDFSSDDVDGMYSWILEIVKPDIENYLSLYRQMAEYDNVLVPTEEEFVMKLVHNALLDRVSVNSNNIGFINEFIFGILIGDAIYMDELSSDDLSDKYVTLVSSVYSAENSEKRNSVYDKIERASLNLNVDHWLMLDMNLKRGFSRCYQNEYIRDMIFPEYLNMTMSCGFKHCTFELCTFERNSIPRNLFDGCCFIKCNFYDIHIIDSDDPVETSDFISCKDIGNFQDELVKGESVFHESDDSHFEKLVLEQFWKKGAEHAEPRKTRLTLMRGISQRDHVNIEKAIESLIDRGILTELINCIQLNFSMIGEVKTILGR